jgi:di/tricarboxylate transporter
MDVHSLHLIIVFTLFILVFVAFLREWLAPDVVALSALGILLITGTIQAIEEAYEAIEWNLLFIIFGMLALGHAMESTGACHTDRVPD